MKATLLVIYLLFFSFLLSCSEESTSFPKNNIQLLLIMGEGKCNQKKCTNRIEFIDKIDIETELNSLIDLSINQVNFIRLKQDTKISITFDAQFHVFQINLEKGHILIANQQELDPKKVSEFNFQVKSGSNYFQGSEYTYLSIQKQPSQDNITLINSLLKVKLNNKEYQRLKVSKNQNGQKKSQYTTYSHPIFFSITQDQQLSEMNELDKVTSAQMQEHIFTLIRGKKNSLSKVSSQYSPNYDGSMDKMKLSINKLLAPDIDGWTLNIYDSQYQPVRKFLSPWRDQDGDGDTDVINRFEWDMIDQKGDTLTEQQYVYHLDAIGENMSERRVFAVDVTPPIAQISLSHTGFSPNGDGNKDLLEINTKLDQDATWKMLVKKLDQEIIFKKDLDPKNTKVTWDGKKQNHQFWPDGEYILEIIGEDSAQNKYLFKEHIFIDNQQHSVSVQTSLKSFSPNQDRFKDTIRFTCQKDNEAYSMEKWSLSITQNGRKIKEWKHSGNEFTPIEWDGLDQSNRKLPDGKYEYQAWVILNTGLEIKSVPQELIIDTTPPNIKLTLLGEYQDFTPDNSGKNDHLDIKIDIDDLSPISTWTLNIYQEDFLIQSIKGNQSPQSEISWDGVGKFRELESFEDYRIEFIAVDDMNLKGNSAFVSFSTGAILIKTERGYLIRISNILFESNKAELIGEKTFIVIDKISSALKRFNNYNLSIEGHTDSDGEKTRFNNEALSESRALSVKNAIEARGVTRNVLYRGHGFKFPLVNPEKSSYDKQRNRRVDFVLDRIDTKVKKTKTKKSK